MTQIQFNKSAYAKMMLHATVNSTTALHGILIGRKSNLGDGGEDDDDDVLVVQDAIPICHSIPTKPIVDMALRLTQAHLNNDNDNGGHDEIIGWYTANERTGDSKIYPTVWKILESIQSFHSETPQEETPQEEKRKLRPIVARINAASFEKMLQKKCNEEGDCKGFDVFELPSSTSAATAAAAEEEEQLEERVLSCKCLGKKQGENWKEVSALVADACLNDHMILYDFENQLEGGVSGLKTMNCDWLRNSQVAKIWEA